MYKQYQQNPQFSRPAQSIERLTDGAGIPFDLANADYQRFKSDLANGVELKDADGNVMTPEQITEFLESLP
jgi:hypothetical protein